MFLPIVKSGAENQEVNKALDQRKIWLKSLTEHVRPGKIVELGCGSGFVLEELTANFPDSVIVGVDINLTRLEAVAKRNFDNVVPLRADLTQSVFPDKTFDTAIAAGVLHEIFSKSGKGGLDAAFAAVHKMLKDDGVMVVQEFLKPPPRPVRMTLKNSRTENIFMRFVNEFKQRKVTFKKVKDGIELDIADAIEFISKYRSPSEDDWKEEMNETHFCLAEKDFEETASRAGFIIRNRTYLPKREDSWFKVKEDIDFDFECEYRWIQLILAKKI